MGLLQNISISGSDFTVFSLYSANLWRGDNWLELQAFFDAVGKDVM